MLLRVYPTERLEGVLYAPGSKSYTHREIIASMLAYGKSNIENYLDCDDTRATMDACQVLGAQIEKEGKLVVYRTGELKAGQINCMESGTTLRLITPVSALAKGVTTITAEGKLKSERPVEDELEAMRQLGIECYSTNDHLPLTVVGVAREGGKCKIPGDVTSQFVSGLLFYLPFAKNYSEIEVTTELKSKPYVKMSLEVLRKRGLQIYASEDLRNFSIPPNQVCVPYDAVIPGDYSSAANPLVAAAITKSGITVIGLYKDGQGDEKILDVLQTAGAKIEIGDDFVRTLGGELYGFEFDATDNPDLVPILTVLALKSNGKSFIHGVKRLVYKESDRLAAIMEFEKMGGNVKLIDDDTLMVEESDIRGADMDAMSDHRNAMAYAVAGFVAKGVTTIHNADTGKSYPNFVGDMYAIGAAIVAR